MDFNFSGKKITDEDGKLKQYILNTDGERFRCMCGCSVLTRFEELYDGEEIYECNNCHSYWGAME